VAAAVDVGAVVLAGGGVDCDGIGGGGGAVLLTTGALVSAPASARAAAEPGSALRAGAL
jgi:hypothetical protein